MKKLSKRLVVLLAPVAMIWLALTVWVESQGRVIIKHQGEAGDKPNALIVYDPDPFYNLDQQVCETFGHVLAKNGWNVTVASVAGASPLTDSSFSLYVFCANTYNWRPDWAVTDFINHCTLKNKRVVAITLGAGSTVDSKRALEKLILQKEGLLIDSRSYWLFRPNDETRSGETNVSVALSMATSHAVEIVEELAQVHH